MNLEKLRVKRQEALDCIKTVNYFIVLLIELLEKENLCEMYKYLYKERLIQFESDREEYREEFMRYDALLQEEGNELRKIYK